jgi:hypothetical protein
VFTKNYGNNKKLLFYTNEGFSEDKQSKPTENCQILGWGKGETAQDAFENLIQEINI